MNAVKFFVSFAVLVACIFAVSAAENEQVRQKRFPFAYPYSYGAYPYSYGGYYGAYPYASYGAYPYSSVYSGYHYPYSSLIHY